MGCDYMDDFFVYLSNSVSQKTFHLFYDCPDLDKDMGYVALPYKKASSHRGFHVCPICQSRKDRQEAFTLPAADSSGLVPSEASVQDTPDVPTSSTPCNSSQTSSHASPFRFWLCVCLSFVIGASIAAYFLQKDIQKEYEKQWLGGYGSGKEIGYQDGYGTGQEEGYASGYDEGYSVGFDESSGISYDEGYDDGYKNGYDDGHDDGYEKGYAETISSSTYNYSSSGTSSSTSGDIEVSGSGSYIPPSTTQSVTVYVTDTGSKYHRAGCSYLKKSSNPISLSSAKAAGYTPCSRCNPPS